jgi:hypothetical protein
MTRDHENSRPAAPANRGITGEPPGLRVPGARMTRDLSGQRHPRTPPEPKPRRETDHPRDRGTPGTRNSKTEAPLLLVSSHQPLGNGFSIVRVPKRRPSWRSSETSRSAPVWMGLGRSAHPRRRGCAPPQGGWRRRLSHSSASSAFAAACRARKRARWCLRRSLPVVERLYARRALPRPRRPRARRGRLPGLARSVRRPRPAVSCWATRPLSDRPR